MTNPRIASPKVAPAAKFLRAAPLFAALGDATRLRLVAQLCSGGPQAIIQLKKSVHVSRQAVTKHLQALERAGLVQSVRSGRLCVWELRTQQIAEAHAHLDQISAQWNQALARLKILVESPLQ